jgi:hypothetical protein
MALVARSVQPHDCDAREFFEQARLEGLGVGTVFRCEVCGQRWFLDSSGRGNLSLERIGGWRAAWAWLTGK